MMSGRQGQPPWPAARIGQAKAKSNYLYLNYLIEMSSCDWFDAENSLVYKCNHFIFTVLEYICCIDLRGTWQQSESANQSNRYKQILSWSTKLSLILYCVCTCHVLIGLYYQYSHDLDLVTLQVLNQNSSMSPPLLTLADKNTNLDGPRSVLFNRIQDSKKLLSAIGAGEYRKYIAVEQMHLANVVFAFVGFGLLYLFYRHVTPYEIYYVREQLDYKREQKTIKQLVEQVVENYLKSDYLFNQIHSPSRVAHCSSGQGHADTITSQLVKVMLANGTLIPANRSSYSFRRRSLLVLCYMISLVIFLIVFYAIMLTDAGVLYVPDSILEISNRVLEYFFCVSFFSFGAATLIGSVDQSVYVNKIRRLVHQCIEINSSEFGKHLRCSSGTEPGPLSDILLVQNSTSKTPSRILKIREPALKMNANLLFILLHYKIFVRQLRPITKTLNPAAAIANFGLLWVPFVVMLHMPYMKLLHAQDNRPILIGLTLSSLLPIDLQILSICYLNARCMNLYRSLSSLAAHIIELESLHGARVYDSHAIMTVFKELRESDRFIDQFTTRLAGLSGTYPTMVRAHFWWGLMMTSILVGMQSNGAGMFESFFSDPFGAFSYVQ